MLFHVEVLVMLKAGIPDPVAIDVGKKIVGMGIDVQAVRIGKRFELQVEGATETDARKKTDEMCLKLLAFQVIEYHKIVSVREG